MAASAKRVLATVKRHLKRRLRLRSLGEANAFVGGGERVCEEKRTRSNSETNAFASGDERDCTRTQTHVRYTLHLNGTVHVSYITVLYMCTRHPDLVSFAFYAIPTL